jgi:hypothetical protein
MVQLRDSIPKASDGQQSGFSRTQDKQIAYEPHWEDLRFPASSINPPGAESDPDVDTTYGTLLFSGTATEVIFVQVQLPHGRKYGSEIRPHVHWAKTTSAAGGVYWKLDYRWSRIGEVMDAAWTTIGGSTPDVSDDDTAEKHALTPLGTIDGTDAELSDMLICKLSRVHDNAADTYEADVRLLEFDFHVQIDAPGSVQLYQKESV